MLFFLRSSSWEPISAIWPFLRTRMRSAILTVEKRWEMSTALLPSVSSENPSNTSYSARASSAAVGSSRMSNCASRMYARPRATFCKDNALRALLVCKDGPRSSEDGRKSSPRAAKSDSREANCPTTSRLTTNRDFDENSSLCT